MLGGMNEPNYNLERAKEALRDLKDDIAVNPSDPAS